MFSCSLKYVATATIHGAENILNIIKLIADTLLVKISLISLLVVCAMSPRVAAACSLAKNAEITATVSSQCPKPRGANIIDIKSPMFLKILRAHCKS